MTSSKSMVDSPRFSVFVSLGFRCPGYEVQPVLPACLWGIRPTTSDADQVGAKPNTFGGVFLEEIVEIVALIHLLTDFHCEIRKWRQYSAWAIISGLGQTRTNADCVHFRNNRLIVEVVQLPQTFQRHVRVAVARVSGHFGVLRHAKPVNQSTIHKHRNPKRALTAMTDFDAPDGRA